MAAGAGSSKIAVYAALVGNFLIACTKFVAAALTGSSAIFAEAIHSVVDTGNQGLLLLGLRRARRPADEDFPFGHGKEIYFWAFVVAILIFAAGSGVSLYEGIRHLQHPEPIRNVTVNYVVLGVAFVFEAAATSFAFRAFREQKRGRGWIAAVRRSKDPTLFTVLFEDSAALAGLVVAFLGILLSQITGDPFYDGAASVVIGLILAGVAIWLAWECKSLLIGEAARGDVVTGIRSLASAEPGIERINKLLTMHMGPSAVLVNLSVDFADARSADEVEEIVVALEENILETHPDVKWVFVEARSWSRRRGRRS